MGKVFISYSTPDIEYAARVYRYLKLNNIESWFAPANIAPGQSFIEEIGKALGWNQLDHVALDKTIEFYLADVQRIEAHLLPTPWIK